jgi:hypothetical protein
VRQMASLIERSKGHERKEDVRGKPTYLSQSVTAVMIALVAMLAVGQNQASGAKPALEPQVTVFQMRVQPIGPRASDPFFASAKQDEISACSYLSQDSSRFSLVVRPNDFLPGLLTGGELAERFITARKACVN